MTPWGWQFNLPVTDGNHHSRTRAAALFLLTLIFTCHETDAAGARPAVHPVRLQRRPRLIITAGPLGRDAATCLCDPVTTLLYTHRHTHTNLSPVYWWSKSFLHLLAFSSHLPVARTIMVELLIYISVIRPLSLLLPTACHWYTPPSSSASPPKWFLILPVSVPLSGAALHKSTPSLDLSRANDRHLFSSTAVSFFTLMPLHTHTHAPTHRCTILTFIPHTCHHIWGDMSFPIN